jgi:hypothetical protein
MPLSSISVGNVLQILVDFFRIRIRIQTYQEIPDPDPTFQIIPDPRSIYKTFKSL